jgi:hypothetical protein
MSSLRDFTCPSLVELLDYIEEHLREPDLSRIGRHVANCPVCAATIHNLDQPDAFREGTGGGKSEAFVAGGLGNSLFVNAKHQNRFKELLHYPQPEATRFGQIWSTCEYPRGHEEFAAESILPKLVVVLVADAHDDELVPPSLIAAPISLDISYQSNFDLRVFEDDSPLGYEFMVEVWNEVPMLETQLARNLGSLNQPAKSYLGLLYEALLGTNVDLSELTGRLGPAILDSNDPRVVFQQEDVAACEYLRRPLFELTKTRSGDDSETSTPQDHVVLFLSNVSVKHNRVPPPARHGGEELPLAASTGNDELSSHFVYATDAGEEILATLLRDLKTKSLYIAWERLASKVKGTRVHIWVYTTRNRTFEVEEPYVVVGKRTPVVQGTQVTPSQVDSVSMRFVRGGSGNGAY